MIYLFNNDAFSYGSISIETSEVEKVYSDLEKYYSKKLGENFAQKTEGDKQGGVLVKDGKYLMLLKGNGAVSIIVSDKESFDSI